MKRIYFIFILFLFFILPISIHAEFKAAIAYRIVTPDPLLPVSGGVGPSEPVEKKIGDLTVRALVLENNGKIIWVVGFRISDEVKITDKTKRRMELCANTKI